MVVNSICLFFTFLTFATVIYAADKKKSGDAGDLNDLLGGMDIGGLLSGVQQMLGGKDGKKGSGMPELDQLKEAFGKLDPKMMQEMLGQLDTDRLAKTMQNMLNPDDVWNMVPEHLKKMMPEDWFRMGKKLGTVLSKEWDKIAGLLDKADKWTSPTELWESLEKEAPVLADLLYNDVWTGTKQRWEKFEGVLKEDAKQYTEQLKTSAWDWLSRQVLMPALRLKTETKENLKEAAAHTFPTLKPLLEKVAANEKLKEWAAQWQMMAELEAMLAKMQSSMEGMKVPAPPTADDEEEWTAYNETTTADDDEEMGAKEEL